MDTVGQVAPQPAPPVEEQMVEEVEEVVHLSEEQQNVLDLVLAGKSVRSESLHGYVEVLDPIGDSKRI